MINQKLIQYLESDSKIILDTIELLENNFNNNKKIDYSFLIMGYFKIIEIEIYNKIFENFKTYYKNREKNDLSKIINNNHSYFLGISNVDSQFEEFLKKKDNFSLGNMLIVLSDLRKIPADPTFNVYGLLKYFLRINFDKSYFLYGKYKLAKRIQDTLSTVRNPAVHSKIFSLFDFKKIENIIIGKTESSGLINLVMNSLVKINNN